MAPPLRVLDLYAGAGGFSAGFSDAGYRVVAAIEVDPRAAATYRANHPEVRVAEKDVRHVTGADGRRLARGSVNVIVGGPPCQGFSITGPRDPDAVQSRLGQLARDR